MHPGTGSVLGGGRVGGAWRGARRVMGWGVGVSGGVAG